MSDSVHIDTQKALQWLEGDEKMFLKIKALFVKNVPSQVVNLKESLETGDVVSAERGAHTLMGSSAMLGASGLSEQAGKIEQSVIAGDLNSALLHYAHFFREYEKIMAELAADGGT